MADMIHCRRCNAVCRTRRAPVRIVDGIEIISEFVYHRDGTRERREIGQVDHATQRILSMHLM